MANYPKCPQCGATGAVGRTFPPCACRYLEEPVVRFRKGEKQVIGGALEADLCPHCGKSVRESVNWFVGEHPEDVLVFDGPAAAYCLGVANTVVGSSGAVPEGSLRQTYDTEEEAVAAFNRGFSSWAKGAAQIGWRCRPIVEHTSDGFYVYARAARFPYS